MTKLAELEKMVARINEMMGTPKVPYIKNEETGKFIAQAGNYHLSHGYGRIALHQMVQDLGGVNDISHGHHTKKEMWFFLWGFIQAIMEIEFTKN